MASISSAGLGSGLDVSGIVNQLMAVEQQPLIKLTTQETKLNAKLSSVAQLKSAVSSFQTSFQALTDASKFGVLSGTSSDTAKVGLSVDPAKAATGSYSVGVSVLAQAQKLQTAALPDVTSSVGTGKLVIQFGTYNSGDNSFTANADKSSATITIDSENDSLAGIRDAINDADAGVTASIVNDGTGYRLVLSSIDTGTKNSLRITVEDDSGGTNTDTTGLSRLAYDPTAAVGAGKNMTQGQAATDAVVNIDGVTVTKSSNVITDAIEGLTLNLKEVTTSNVSLTVAKDSSGIKSGIQALIKGYNTFLQAMTDLGGYKAETKTAGPLQGETVVRTIQSEVRATMNMRLTGNTRTLRSLSDVGIEFQRDGTLKFNEAKLNTAIKDHFEEIAGLFGAFGIASDSNISYQSSTSSTKVGTYAVNLTTAPTQASYNGSTPGGGFTFPLTIDANNSTLQVVVDDSPSGTISLTQGSYASGAALAAELQSKINGDSGLKGAGKTVTVTFNATLQRLEFKSNTYGADSTFEIAAVGTTTAATLGFDVATGTAGTDVAGSIGGFDATASGQYLTGKGMASGLKLKIGGEDVGDRGTVDFSKGIASHLDDLLDQMLGSGGIVDSKTASINKSIKDLGKQRESMAARLTQVEARYRAQFTQLDTLISSFKQTSAALTSQLASLPGISTGS